MCSQVNDHEAIVESLGSNIIKTLGKNIITSLSSSFLMFINIIGESFHSNLFLFISSCA